MRPLNLKLNGMTLALLGLLTAAPFATATSYNFRVATPGLKPSMPASSPAPTGPFNFTTCSRTGPTGPSQSLCNTAYASSSLSGLVTVSGGIQSWTVPTTGIYTVNLAGAVGGSETTPVCSPGRGAVLTTQLSLTQGTVIQILVGQAGVPVTYDAGGGGATYIAQGGAALAVAGGGGGSGCNGGHPGLDASTNLTLTNADSPNNTYGYSGGAGFTNNGTNAANTYTGFGTAYSFLNGGAGASVFENAYNVLASGGFGGGGGGGYPAAGSGGGYSPSNTGEGNGGNTYSSGTITSSVATNTGQGYVTFTKN